MGAALTVALGACIDYAGPIPSPEQTTNQNNGDPGGGNPGNGNSGNGNPGTGDPGTGDPGGGDNMGGPQPPPDDMGTSGNADAVSFNEDVYPILVEMCSMCHAEPGGSVPGHAAADPNVAFDEVQDTSQGAPVYERILERAAGVGGFMPPGYVGCEELDTPGCLTQDQYDTIKLWVEQGAMNR